MVQQIIDRIAFLPLANPILYSILFIFVVSTFFGWAIKSSLFTVKQLIFRNKRHFNTHREHSMKIEYKLKLSEDRGPIQKIEDRPLINQVDGQPRYRSIG